MLAWMIYAVLVSAVLSVAAFMAERGARGRGARSRWSWFASMLASVVVPVIMAGASIRVPQGVVGSHTSPTLALRDATSIGTPLTQLRLDSVPVYGMSLHVDSVAAGLWIAASTLMALTLLLGTVWIARRKRTWRSGTLCGERVRISLDTGPAVVGVIRPDIVVPEWLLRMDAAQQEHALVHERSHLDARDPMIIAIALVALTAMPWNAPLWWQLHRLRRAIEMDCDARVLRGGCDVAAYCEVLLSVGQRKSRHIPLLPAMSESASFLEVRMRRMLRAPGKWVRTTTAACLCLSFTLAVVAAQVTPPTVPSTDMRSVDGYIGVYRVNPMSLVRVSREPGGLVVAITGQMAAPAPFHVVRTDADRFVVRGNDALALRFVTDDAGRASRLVATQAGRVILDVPRIDEAEAQRIDGSLAARIEAQRPFPGSEAALRLFLSDSDGGAGMSPELAFERRRQKAERETYLARIGAVRSWTFTGVNAFGADTYLVKRANGEETVMLVVDPDGTLATAVRYSSAASPPAS